MHQEKNYLIILSKKFKIFKIFSSYNKWNIHKLRICQRDLKPEKIIDINDEKEEKKLFSKNKLKY